MRTLIYNVKLVEKSGITDGAAVLIRDGKIEYVSRDGAMILPAVDESIDGEGTYLSAGFIDIHVHGGGGHDFMDGTEEAFRGAMASHMAHGTTSIVPTTLTAEDEELCEVFAVARRVRSSRDAENLPEILGLHLEGPYVEPSMAGAQDPKYIKVPSDLSWKGIVEAADGDLLIWTVAPELEGADEMAEALRDSGIIFSAGHSAAKYDDCVRAINAGYTMATHLYSSMSTIIRENGYRVPGVLEASLLHDEICAEVIADGLHLPPSLLKLIYKTKGGDRMVLVTDAMRGAGMPDGEYLLGSLKRGQLVSVFDGIAHMPDGISFAGSVATADRLVRVMTTMAGVPLNEVIAMITENPAREVGVADHKGKVEVGYDADLVMFDGNINVKSVWCRGKKTV
ncbi:MAG: N-acetylglucosamine-6-phosphate deacetylase [Clostridia bacterium]|nr:N-acetylglucosamine-6-phosphate deacetylase [Clostridia bacterium]